MIYQTTLNIGIGALNDEQKELLISLKLLKEDDFEIGEIMWSSRNYTKDNEYKVNLTFPMLMKLSNIFDLVIDTGIVYIS